MLVCNDGKRHVHHNAVIDPQAHQDTNQLKVYIGFVTLPVEPVQPVCFIVSEHAEVRIK